MSFNVMVFSCVGGTSDLESVGGGGVDLVGWMGFSMGFSFARNS